ncbi:dTDP-glucose 4,6-dehydratase [Peribacillus psychrosaccharolyticus]|uniref:dTDP-glucose 4,6-dehydratase n=1 Tax=Peribacillus psychrosaccharolyticus TaxID=1407 RepID=A0A974NQA5_PERPY|nr:dTDP-glucose 4,6-dehydratase [Peribacillus psychrosaccharolyticus]MEC2057418.1 dTDP-glucose 4,6-dehydratase [Peribacillus psychrosaccharolyticus]MED3745873.1 dTDP-glucose 4,6-dehydratase [Peribacillus psychrosaccharolyticus]QQT01852.1 dTDP-glucose 4,6-dehydratase [Peribacillus psychrosaccharolyticus]
MVKKKILITGGAGFIGGNFVHYILNKYPEYEVVNLDALTYAGELTKHQEVENLPNYHFTHIDITDKEQLSNLCIEKEFDYVIHFAAESHVDRSIANPEQFILTNVLGTQNLLQAAKQTKISKFIHISTDEVYGELDFDKTNFFTETTPLQPNSPYSASKASSDLLVRAYAETYQLPVNITRCSNNYGPFQFPEKLIPLTISKILNDKKVPIYGNGQNIRDWLHVYDHCTAIDAILHKGINGEVYNIGGHNEKTNLDVVRTIIHTIGKSEKLIEHVEDRLGHDKRYAIDPTKLEQLGWKPTYTFETGIRQTIDWYIKNKQWLNQVLNKKK